MSVFRRRALATGIGVLAAGGGLAALTRGQGTNPLAASFASSPVKLDFVTPATGLVNRAGFNLFARMIAKDPTRNAVLAPGSVVVALAMAAAATSGSTRADLAAAIDAETGGALKLDDLIDRLGALDRALKIPADGTEIGTAAALLVAHGLTPDDALLKSLETAFAARARSVDFGSQSTADDLNQWIGDKTRGLIDKVVSRFDPDTKLVLATAVFFKGRWLTAFDPQNTRDDVFRAENGREIEMPMMHLNGTLPYTRVDAIQAVSLAYRGTAFEMIVAMPAERGNTKMGRWASEAGPHDWAGILNSGAKRPREVMLRLPRQEVEAEADLRQHVADSAAFAPLMQVPAWFGQITKAPLKVGKVLHKALVRMDEEGTVAAAATVVDSMRISALPSPIDFTIDRPHVFLIRHVPTGMVVFAGYVADPKPLPAPAG